jgi:hypothetical protein
VIQISVGSQSESREQGEDSQPGPLLRLTHRLLPELPARQMHEELPGQNLMSLQVVVVPHETNGGGVGVTQLVDVNVTVSVSVIVGVSETVVAI